MGFASIPFNIISRAQAVARIIRREGCEAVVACTGDFYDLPASYLASRLARVPFYPYIFDYYSQQWTEEKARRLAERFEPRLMKGARGIIVPNEFMRDELCARYNVEASVIRNCCDLSLYESPDANDICGNDSGDEIRIVYTGALSEAQIEAFRNLMKALDVLGRASVRLHLYTAQSPSVLDEKGIAGPIIFHGHKTTSEAALIQRRADVLFLPLAFDSKYPAVIKTSAPGKMGDYLAARRPVLVHAPPDSFLAWYFREHGCGLVVDENDPAKLAEGLERLLKDCDLRAQLCSRAWERALSDFSDHVAREKFARLLKLE